MEDCLDGQIGGAVFLAINAGYTAIVVSLRTGQSASSVILGEASSVATSILSLAPIGWLMAQIYVIAAWASLLFALIAANSCRQILMLTELDIRYSLIGTSAGMGDTRSCFRVMLFRQASLSWRLPE